jgi:hypothetical protein
LDHAALVCRVLRFGISCGTDYCFGAFQRQ